MQNIYVDEWGRERPEHEAILERMNADDPGALAEHTALLLRFSQECYSDGEDFRRHPERFTLGDTPPTVEDAAYDMVQATLRLARYALLADDPHASHLGQWLFLTGASSRRWEVTR